MIIKIDGKSFLLVLQFPVNVRLSKIAFLLGKRRKTFGRCASVAVGDRRCLSFAVAKVRTFLLAASVFRSFFEGKGVFLRKNA